MASELEQTLEALPGWGEWKEALTKRGRLMRRIMFPVHSNAWTLWKRGEEAMRKNGYEITKTTTGKWVLVRYREQVRPELMQKLIEESKAEGCDANLLLPPGLEYRPFQKAGIKYAIDRLHGQNGMQKRPGVLIADDMGLGKTVQFLGIVNQDANLRDLRILIICPASLKLNWRNEARKWILDGAGYNAVVVKKEWPKPGLGTNIVIVNYDVLHKYAREIRSETWDYVCCDEAHYLKNELSRRSIFALGGAYGKGEKAAMVSPIRADQWVFLSGTPMENGKATEMWPIIEKCDPTGLGRDYGEFRTRYRDTDEFLEELQTHLRMRIMVRRMKQDVLKELPPKVRQVVPIDPEEYGGVTIFGEEMRLFREYQECLKDWAVRTELAKAEGVSVYRETIKEKKAKIGMTAGELAKLRKKTALAKVKGVIDQVKTVLEDSEHLILFAHHIEVLDKLEEGLKAAKITVVRVDGSTKQEARQKAVEDFQDGKFQVFLGGLKPCGVGLTLTRATRVAFVELDWLPGAMTQAEDRAHRIGQTDVVFVLHLVMEGSLDEYIAKRLIEKQENISRALDSMAGEEEDEVEDEDEQRDSFAAPDRAASKGYSAEKIEEDARRLTPEMKESIRGYLQYLVGSALSKLNGTDQQLARTLAQGATNDARLAIGRKIAWRYRHLLGEGVEDALKFPKTEKQ